MNISAFFIEDQRKIRTFVFKITDVNMHAQQALLTLLNNVHSGTFLSGLVVFFRFFFFRFSFLLVVSQNNTFSDGKETVKFPEEAVR